MGSGSLLPTPLTWCTSRCIVSILYFNFSCPLPSLQLLHLKSTQGAPLALAVWSIHSTVSQVWYQDWFKPIYNSTAAIKGHGCISPSSAFLSVDMVKFWLFLSLSCNSLQSYKNSGVGTREEVDMHMWRWRQQVASASTSKLSWSTNSTDNKRAGPWL